MSGVRRQAQPSGVFDTCEPREDVIKGTIAGADFAADLAKVIRGTARPVALIRAKNCNAGARPGGMFKRILIPLDGSEAGEAALPYDQTRRINVGGSQDVTSGSLVLLTDRSKALPSGLAAVTDSAI